MSAWLTITANKRKRKRFCQVVTDTPQRRRFFQKFPDYVLRIGWIQKQYSTANLFRIVLSQVGEIRLIITKSMCAYGGNAIEQMGSGFCIRMVAIIANGMEI